MNISSRLNLIRYSGQRAILRLTSSTEIFRREMETVSRGYEPILLEVCDFSSSKGSVHFGDRSTYYKAFCPKTHAECAKPSRKVISDGNGGCPALGGQCRRH